MKKITVPARLEQLPMVTEFVSKELILHDCPEQTQYQVSIAVEEIFVNIANYAYCPLDGDTTIIIRMEDTPLRIIITFMDHGVPYNPLSQPDPDTTLPASEREIGGLGIYLVKKNMDAVNYRYENNQNIFTIMKHI